MIGIINKTIGAYSIIEKIHHNFPNIDIYLYGEENEEAAIKIMIEKKCKIIILSEENKPLINKYPEIIFISSKRKNKKNEYYLENNDLIKAVEEGNLKVVKEILNKIDIPKEKTIVINNPILLFIKEILEETYKNKIIDNTNYLIDSINEIIQKEKLIINKIGNIKRIIIE